MLVRSPLGLRYTVIMVGRARSVLKMAELNEATAVVQDPENVPPSARAKERRARLRELQWGPGVDDSIWHKREKGFCTIPRTLPLVVTLIRQLSRNVDAGRVYLDLWARQFEDGYVDVADEAELASSCGYANGSRGVKSWREAMKLLEDLGFITSKPKGQRKYGYVLLIHPHRVVAELLDMKGSKVPDWWVGLYERRLIEIGAKPV
jgi:hypothetical protein